jgi:hypothetical protein
MRYLSALILIVLIALSCASCSKNEQKEKEEAEYSDARNACWTKWNANDTMRHSAFLAVQIQMQRIDQLSKAPKDAEGAISLLCKFEAEKAVENLKYKNLKDKSKFFD